MTAIRAIFTAILVSGAAVGLTDALDETVAKMMQEDHVPGCALAIVDPSGQVEKRAYGVSNLELDTPFRTDSVFRIASLSKQFCAYAVLSLAREGKLSLTDSIRKHLPEAPESWEGITIQHMLSHMSGIADPGYAFDYAAEYTVEQYVEILARKPLAEEPGTHYRYNNHAYALLGQIVGRLSGGTLAQYVSEKVFKSVGMKDTRYYDPEEIVKGRVDSYRWRNERLIKPLELRPQVFAGSGGILSTIDDMTRYELALRKKDVLDGSILAQQWKDQTGIGAKYGFGWHLDADALRHTGTTFGFTSCFLRRNDGWTVIVFKNSDGGESVAWARSILEAYVPSNSTTASASVGGAGFRARNPWMSAGPRITMLGLAILTNRSASAVSIDPSSRNSSSMRPITSLGVGR